MNSLFDHTEKLENKNYFEELVGDGKKFKDQEALARSKYESDNFIERLKIENDQLRNDYLKLSEESKAQAKLQELVDRMASKEESSNNQPNVNDNKPTIDSNQLKSFFSSEIKEYETQKKQEANFEMVRNKLEERFGDKSPQVLKEHMDRLGLNEEFVNDLARKHPNAFFQTFGLNDMPNNNNLFSSPPQSSVRPNAFQQRQQKRTWSYYQDLKKTNPSLYHQPKTQNQMHNDYLSLGQEFEDGDFHSI